jgi:Mn2+/Fe2+ NRAMP family transporter
MVEKIAKPLMVLLGGSLVLAAILSKPDLHAVVRGFLFPSVPEANGIYSYTLILMALTGAGAGSLSNLKYAAFVHERGWRDPSFLRRQRIDLLLSGIGLYVMFALVQVAAAATLRISGSELKRVEDLVPLFSAALGDAGRIVLALGLWAAVFTTYLGANTGYSLMVTDIWNNVLRKGERPESETGSCRHADHPAYQWCLIWFCASPMYVLLTSWKPLWLALLSAALMVVLLPVIVLVLLWMTNNRKRMGDHANGWAVNGAMMLAVVASLYLTAANAVQVWSALAR